MKRKDEKKSLKIDLVNLEKVASESMGLIRAGDDDPLCICVEKGGEYPLIITVDELVKHVIP